ncbi:MAG: metalloregulator ArsR/SmtB family transcription factor [Burkholderiales bacterium]|jgi:DNA-binding transcriptional ArsR family regulator|nr:metalloregulator ArsR/SmtB family transcription factor [Burkholderiales bacterium]
MKRGLDLAGETGAVRALAALAQVSRLRVFRLLVGAGPDGLCPGQIAATLDVSANLLSFHLKELQACGLITQEREGRFLRYRADMQAMQQLMQFMTAHCCHGEPCVAMPAMDCSAHAGW